MVSLGNQYIHIVTVMLYSLIFIAFLNDVHRDIENVQNASLKHSHRTRTFLETFVRLPVTHDLKYGLVKTILSSAYVKESSKASLVLIFGFEMSHHALLFGGVGNLTMPTGYTL